jgi:hypothetical protein
LIMSTIRIQVMSSTPVFSCESMMGCRFFV